MVILNKLVVVVVDMIYILISGQLKEMSSMLNT